MVEDLQVQALTIERSKSNSPIQKDEFRNHRFIGGFFVLGDFVQYVDLN